MPWNYRGDPLYRALLAEVADLEWQITEQNFLDAQVRRDLALSVQHAPPSLPVPTQGDSLMADNKQDRGEPDRSRINLSEDYEVRYWTKELGVSEEALRRAIAATGSSSAARIREYLKTSD